jgi:hypothetical protein
MSIGALVKDDTVLPIEVSLTRTPAYEDARSGPAEALATFEMLTEVAPDDAAVTRDIVGRDGESGRRRRCIRRSARREDNSAWESRHRGSGRFRHGCRVQGAADRGVFALSVKQLDRSNS